MKSPTEDVSNGDAFNTKLIYFLSENRWALWARLCVPNWQVLKIKTHFRDLKMNTGMMWSVT